MWFMRKLKQKLAEWLIKIIFKIGEEMEMVAMLYASRILSGKKTFANVPDGLKAQVADYLINDCERPDLVPVEFGGTLED